MTIPFCRRWAQQKAALNYAKQIFLLNISGTSALEFSMIMPLIIVLALVAYDLARYTIFVRKVHLTASTMANFIARNDTGTINQADMDAIFQSQLVVFPEIMKEAKLRNQSVWSVIHSSLSGVQFKSQANCTKNCTYTPYVAWTGGIGRPCGVPLNAAPDIAQPSPSTLPADTFGSGFLIVADVAIDYIPLFLQSVVGNIQIRRSFYIAPRYVSAITYDASAGSSFTWSCAIP